MSSGTVRAALALGSNLGDRVRQVNDAVDTVSGEPGVTVVGVSGLVETHPVGGPPQPDYVNAVVAIDTVLSPLALLALAQRCEQQAGRVRAERWGPRTLDVDVLAYDAVESADPALTLPHPRATQRAFVMVPWAEVDPEFVVSGRSVSEWAGLLDASGLRRMRVES